MEPNKNTFTHCTSDDSRIFPIDYSVREFTTLKNISRNKFKKTVLLHPLFQNILQQLHWSKKPNVGKSVSRKSAPVSVPLEVSTLLFCFFTLANHPDYANSIIKQIDGINKETMDDFSNELCQLLCEETSPDSVKHDNAFCRHILFQNKRFSTEVLRAMWEEEIETRYQKLKGLLLQASFDMQSAVILDCLRALDLSIIKLESGIHSGVSTPEGKTDSAVQDEEPLPQELLKQLLSWRIQT